MPVEVYGQIEEIQGRSQHLKEFNRAAEKDRDANTVKMTSRVLQWFVLEKKDEEIQQLGEEKQQSFTGPLAYYPYNSLKKFLKQLRLKRQSKQQ